MKTRYENPAATVDLILEYDSKVLLIQRGREPFKDSWALPGGHLENGKETLEEAGVRELREETGLVTSIGSLELIRNYSEPGRDPRGHVISHAYKVKNFVGELKAGDDAKEARWFALDKLPDLAFDHEKIITDYLGVKNELL